MNHYFSTIPTSSLSANSTSRSVASRASTTTSTRFDIRCLLSYEVHGASDFLFNIEVAPTPQQKVLISQYAVSNATNLDAFTANDLPNKFIRFSAASGAVDLTYNATVALTHYWTEPSVLAEAAIAAMPQEALPYLLPSRYCESDKIFQFANANFGHLPQGYGRVQAICDWVHGHVRFTPGASNATTSAIDTLNSGAGVCRDFSHLTIALLRALNIPARFVAGYDYGADPALGPTDFHAYVEVFLGDRWYIFDASKLCPRNGLVRIGTGFDAADVAFATIFGPSRFSSMDLSIRPVDPCGAAIEISDNPALAISTAKVGDLLRQAPIVTRTHDAAHSYLTPRFSVGSRQEATTRDSR